MFCCRLLGYGLIAYYILYVVVGLAMGDRWGGIFVCEVQLMMWLLLLLMIVNKTKEESQNVTRQCHVHLGQLWT